MINTILLASISVVLVLSFAAVISQLAEIIEAIKCRHDSLTGDNKPIPFNEVKFANGGYVTADEADAYMKEHNKHQESIRNERCVEVNWTPDTAAPTPDKQYQPICVHGIPRSDVCPVCIHGAEPIAYIAFEDHEKLFKLLVMEAEKTFKALLEKMREQVKRFTTPPTVIPDKQPSASKKYVPWQEAGGPKECCHGYAKGIDCPDCDRIKTVIALLENRQRRLHNESTIHEAVDFDKCNDPSCVEVRTALKG